MDLDCKRGPGSVNFDRLDSLAAMPSATAGVACC